MVYPLEYKNEHIYLNYIANYRVKPHTTLVVYVQILTSSEDNQIFLELSEILFT